MTNKKLRFWEIRKKDIEYSIGKIIIVFSKNTPFYKYFLPILTIKKYSIEK